MNIGISMNHGFRICQFQWTHEFHFWKIHEPMTMKTDIAINSRIWISNFSWTHEYEYGHVTLWTFKSSYSSWNCMNHAMSHMNCNACLFLVSHPSLWPQGERGEWRRGGGGEREDWPPCSTLTLPSDYPCRQHSPPPLEILKKLGIVLLALTILEFG